EEQLSCCDWERRCQIIEGVSESVPESTGQTRAAYGGPTSSGGSPQLTAEPVPAEWVLMLRPALSRGGSGSWRHQIRRLSCPTSLPKTATSPKKFPSTSRSGGSAPVKLPGTWAFPCRASPDCAS